MGIELMSTVFGLFMGITSAWGSSVVFAVKMSNSFNSRLEELETGFQREFNVLHQELVKQAQSQAVQRTAVDSRFELLELKIMNLQEKVQVLGRHYD